MATPILAINNVKDAIALQDPEFIVGTGYAADGTMDAQAKTSVALTDVNFTENTLAIGHGTTTNGSSSDASGGAAGLRTIQSLAFTGGKVDKTRLQ